MLGSYDSLAVGAGLDWSGTSDDPHSWIPVVAQWNIWLTPAFSLRFEPGVSLLVGNGTHVAPALYLGARYRIYRCLYVAGRVGIPDAAIGAALLL